MLKKKNAEIGGRNSVSEGELELINKYSRRQLTAEEIYTFNVVLCDNDVDRDCEYFTKDALYSLAEMFVGVTGIFDHNPTAKNQVARIYSCAVEDMQPQLTAYGDTYCRLTAKAYMPVCDSNEDLIAMLDAGIQKEVSVGCRVDECRCSICGEDMRNGYCGHKKGEFYGGKQCCGVLSAPSDAYEWSFTAVPSQRKAGVIKSFGLEIDEEYEEKTAQKLLKKSDTHNENVTISKDDFNIMKNYVERLKKKSEQTDRYKSMLELETVKSAVVAKSEIDCELLEPMVKGLDLEQLIKLKGIFEKKAAEILPIQRQILRDENNISTAKSGSENNLYCI